jgi:hypothetical protein
VSDEAIGYLAARIASHLDGSDEAAPVARMLIEAVRAEAEDNRAIGKGVMVNSLPIAPGPPTGDVLLIGGMPEGDARTFTYLPHGGWEGRYLGPLVVSSDGSQMANYEATGTQVRPVGGSTGMSYRPASAPPMPKTATGQSVRLYKLGRNEPCWCGSGTKYKKCHGANAR